MKHFHPVLHQPNAVSHSARSAWIETMVSHPITDMCVSHSARSAWIETFRVHFPSGDRQSHSARSAWIETYRFHKYRNGRAVALRKECVD